MVEFGSGITVPLYCSMRAGSILSHGTFGQGFEVNLSSTLCVLVMNSLCLTPDHNARTKFCCRYEVIRNSVSKTSASYSTYFFSDWVADVLVLHGQYVAVQNNLVWLYNHSYWIRGFNSHIPDSKVNGANMVPTWVLSAPDGPHVGAMNLAIRDILHAGLLHCHSNHPSYDTRKCEHWIYISENINHLFKG